MPLADIPPPPPPAAPSPQVLFFDLPFYQSLWAGVIIGTAYTTVSRIYAALQRAAMRYHLQSQLRADADAPPSR